MLIMKSGHSVMAMMCDDRPRREKQSEKEGS